MNNNVALEDILATIENWKIEAAAGHNDGWVVQSYRDKLQKLREYLETTKEIRVIT